MSLRGVARINFTGRLDVGGIGNCRVKQGGKIQIVLREEMLEQADEIEGHLRDDMETQCSGNILKYKKQILAISLNNGVYGFLMIHHLSPSEASNAKTRLHMLELLPKGSHGNTPQTQTFDDTLGCLMQTYRSASLLKITGTYIESSLQCPWCREVLCGLPKEKGKWKPSLKTFNLQSVLPINGMPGQSWHRTCKSSQPISILT